MGKQYTIGYMKIDQKEIKGKPVDNVQIKLVNATGSEKWENIPAFNKCFSAVAVCKTGDMVDVTYEKKNVNGKDYFNVVGFTKIGEGACLKETIIPSASGASPAPAKSYGGGKNEDTQLSICRQSSNTAAMNFVVGMLANGIYGKKANPEMLFEEVKRFAKKFEEYVTLKGDYGAVDAAFEDIDTSTKETFDEDDSVPF